MPEVELISGLSVTAREFVVEDQRWLFHKSTLRKGLLLQKMLEIVTTGYSDPGPYNLEGTNVPWGRIAMVDQMHALVLLRCEEDPIMELKPSCEHCGELIHPEGISADLTEVEVKPMMPVAVEHLSTGEPLSFLWHKEEKVALVDAEGRALTPPPAGGMVEVPKSEVNPRGGKMVSWDPAQIIKLELRVLLGKDQVLMAKLSRQDPDGVLEHQTCVRILTVQDPGWEGGAVLKVMKSIQQWYRKQGNPLRRALESWYDLIEGGPEMEIAADCVNCRRGQKVSIPFGPEFFGLIRR